MRVKLILEDRNTMIEGFVTGLNFVVEPLVPMNFRGMQFQSHIGMPNKELSLQMIVTNSYEGGELELRNNMIQKSVDDLDLDFYTEENK